MLYSSIYLVFIDLDFNFEAFANLNNSNVMKKHEDKSEC